MSKNSAITAIVSLFILGLSSFAFSEENLTITTYYPSPYGSYRELTAHRMKIGANYSDSGTNVPDNNLIVEGNVGIGTTTPQTQLDVAGGIKPGMVNDSDCGLSTSGTLRWSSVDGKVQYCDGNQWQSIVREQLSATCEANYTFNTSYSGCSCGSATYVWEGMQTCTCNADGTSWNCVADCGPPYRPIPDPCP